MAWGDRDEGLVGTGHGGSRASLRSSLGSATGFRLRPRAPLEPQSPPARSVGEWVGSRDRSPVAFLRAATSALALEPPWTALHAAPRLRRWCSDYAMGHRGTVVTWAPWFMRGRNCGLWDPQSLLSSYGATCFLLSFPEI